MAHSDAWHAANAARCAAVIAYCDNPCTETEQAMHAACSARQASLFAPPHAGVATGGQPEPSGLADRDYLGVWEQTI